MVDTPWDPLADTETAPLGLEPITDSLDTPQETAPPGLERVPEDELAQPSLLDNVQVLDTVPVQPTPRTPPQDLDPLAAQPAPSTVADPFGDGYNHFDMPDSEVNAADPMQPRTSTSTVVDPYGPAYDHIAARDNRQDAQDRGALRIADMMGADPLTAQASIKYRYLDGSPATQEAITAVEQATMARAAEGGDVLDPMNDSLPTGKRRNKLDMQLAELYSYYEQQTGGTPEDFARLNRTTRKNLAYQMANEFLIKNGYDPRDIGSNHPWWRENVSLLATMVGDDAGFATISGVTEQPEAANPLFVDSEGMDPVTIRAHQLNKFEDLIRERGGELMVEDFHQLGSIQARMNFIQDTLAAWHQRNYPDVSEKDRDDWVRATFPRFIDDMKNIEFTNRVRDRQRDLESELIEEGAPTTLRRADQPDVNRNSSWLVDSFDAVGSSGARALAGMIGFAVDYSPGNLLARKAGEVTGIDALSDGAISADPVTDMLNNWADSVDETMTLESEAAMAGLGEVVENGSPAEMAGYVVQNPRVLPILGSNMIGFILGSGGVAGGARALAARTVGKIAPKAGAALSSQGVKNGVALTAVAAAEGGDSAEQAGSYYREMPLADLQMMPGYYEAKARLGPEATEADIREHVALRAEAVAAATGFAGGLISAAVGPLDRMFSFAGQANRGASQIDRAARGTTRLGNATREAIGEGLGEAVIAGGQNLATGQDVMSYSTLNQALLGAGLGGALGGIAGPRGGPDTPPDASVTNPTDGENLKAYAEQNAAAREQATEIVEKNIAERQAMQQEQEELADIDLDELMDSGPTRAATATVDSDLTVSEEIPSAEPVNLPVQSAKAMTTPYTVDERTASNSTEHLRHALNDLTKTLSRFNNSLHNPGHSLEQRQQTISDDLMSRVGIEQETAERIATELAPLNPRVPEDEARIIPTLERLKGEMPDEVVHLDTVIGERRLYAQAAQKAAEVRQLLRPKRGQVGSIRVPESMRSASRETLAGQLESVNDELIATQEGLPKPDYKALNTQRRDETARIREAQRTTAGSEIAQREAEQRAKMPAIGAPPKAKEGQILRMLPFEPTGDFITDMLQRIKRAPGAIIHSLDAADSLRVVDQYLRNNRLWSDSRVHGSFYDGEGIAQQMLEGAARNISDMQLKAKTLATQLGVSMSDFTRDTTAYIETLNAIERAEVNWMLDNIKNLKPVAKNRVQEIMVTADNIVNPTEADSDAWYESMRAVFNDTKNHRVKISSVEDYLVKLPGGREPLTRGQAQEYVDAMRADPAKASALDAMVPMLQEFNKTQRANQAQAGLASGIGRGWPEIYNFKYYIPFDFSASGDSKLLMEQDVALNTTNKRIMTMRRQEAATESEAEIGEPTLKDSKDIFDRMKRQSVVNALQARDQVAMRDMTEAARRIGRPTSVASVTTAERVYDKDEGRFFFTKELPTQLDDNMYLTRRSDGGIDILTIYQDNINETYRSRMGKGKDLPAPFQWSAKLSRYYGEFIVLNPRYMLGTAVWRDLEEAFMVTVNKQGWRAGAASLRNLFAGTISHAPMLRRFYAADAETKKQMLVEMRKIPELAGTVERYEQMGVIGHRASLAPRDVQTIDDLVDSVESDRDKGVIRSSMDFMRGLATTMDNVYRDVAYKALTDAGVPKSEAVDQVRNIMNFYQRAGNPTVQSAGRQFAFFNTSLVGLHTVLTRRMFDGNEMPTVNLQVGGQTIVKPDWSRIYNVFSADNQIAKAQAMAYMAKGAASVGAIALFSGYDDEENPNVSNLPAWRYMANSTIPIFYNENGQVEPFRIPAQYGVSMVFHAIGAAGAMLAMGTHDPDEVTHELVAVLLANAVPLGRFNTNDIIHQINTDGTNAAVKTALNNLMPSWTQPLMQVATNVNAFGSSVYNEQIGTGRDVFPVLRYEDGRPDNRLSTPQAFVDIASAFENVPGADLFKLNSPEVVQHMVRSYLSWPGDMAVTALRNIEQASYDPNYSLLTDGVLNMPGSPIPTIRDARFKAQRDASKMIDVYDRMEAERERLRDADKFEEKRDFRDGYIGKREREWRRANPEWARMKAVTERHFRRLSSYEDQIRREEALGREADRSRIHRWHEARREVYVDLNDELRKIIDPE